MIRINLLQGEREKPRAARTAIPAGQRLTLIGSLILLGMGLFIGWWYLSLQNQTTRLDEEIALAQGETTRLAGVLAEVRQFEARRAQLAERVALIEQLRNGQTEPVHLLDEISLSLPDLLWLTDLTQKDGDITIDGRAITLAALSDFVGNLERSAYFRRPVEIVNSQVESQAQGDMVRFSIKARFAAPGS
jgi:type IV pilus assembly protein PilN